MLALEKAGKLPARQSVPVCTVCHTNPVAAEDGWDTCEDCLAAA